MDKVKENSGNVIEVPAYKSNLKVGDIKKFKHGDDECIGVVVYKDDTGVMLCNTEGQIWDLCRHNSIPLYYSATRLDTKVREGLERVAEVYKKINKIDDEINKLEKLKEKEEKSLDKEIRNLVQVQGKLTLNQVFNFFNKLLEKNYPSIYTRLRDNYESDFSDSGRGIWIQYDRFKKFDSWCDMSRYDFLSREYDGVLMADKETEQYRSLCEKYSAGDAKFKLSELNGKFKSKSELQAGGRDSLYYHHAISIFVPYECMTKAYLIKLVKTIK